MEIADLAKRENLVDEAAYWFHKVNQLQPFASQGWLEHAKMEEECGRLETCQGILQTGLRFCPYNESLLVKGIKHQEQMSDLLAARSLLARLKHVRLEKSWKTILEGALFEARAGKLSIARKVRWQCPSLGPSPCLFLCRPLPLVCPVPRPASCPLCALCCLCPALFRCGGLGVD